MTLQQLEYVLAVARNRHFVRAAEECGVSQPTLSMMIQRLEDELGVKIFDRTKHPLEPTELGRRVISQIERVVFEKSRLSEMIKTETESLSGVLRVGIIPTVAPYLVPDFISTFVATYPNIDLSISEMRTKVILEQIDNSMLDMAIVTTPLPESKLLEIPLYYEPFWAYFADGDQSMNVSLGANHMPLDTLWVLQEGHCIRGQVFNFCNTKLARNRLYEAGSIDTLIRIVDRNGGYTIIPELHLQFLTDKQKQNIRPITSPPAVREISIIIRNDYVREGMINAVAETVKRIIPQNMLNERLKKYSIKLA